MFPILKSISANSNSDSTNAAWLPLWHSNRRNEVCSDGLIPDTLCDRLEICWYARDLHPWDQGLSPEKREAAFNEKAMEDIEAAVDLILERRPDAEALQITVLHPHSCALLASGAVGRSALHALGVRSPSVRMRLGELGVQCFSTPGASGPCRAEPTREPAGDFDHRRIA